MTYLSICSGIEAATVAWHPLGWEAVAFSEIEPFACAVLAHHWPAVPNLGDMTAYKEWPDVGSVDLLVGGTPCQSFSVAGLREGLDDPRGSLMLVYLAIARRFAPRWVVWENVPGVLSSHKGRDFGTFLGGLAECGYGFAYRVLDAQWFGVPQRRRRVFVVGYLGDWRPPAAVLFERESLRGYPPPSREAGERVAGTVDAGAHPGGFNGRDAETGKLIAGTLGANHGNIKADQAWGGSLIAFAQNTRDEVRLQGGDGKIAGACAAEPGMKQTTYIAHALRADGFDASEDGTGRGTPLVQAFYSTEGRFDNLPEPGMSPPLKVGSNGGGQPPAANTRTGVRRLTPRECERLQGFPDDFTLIQYPPNPRRVKWAADGPRYRALGNSMAVPVMRWLGERIEAVRRTP